PQVLRRAAAAADDDHIRFARTAQADRTCKIERGTRTLHLCRREADARPRRACADDLEDVVQRGTGRRCHDADRRRVAWQRSLPLGCEEAFILELAAESLERDPPESAGTVRFKLAYDELVLAASLVQRDRTERAHLHAFVG